MFSQFLKLFTRLEVEKAVRETRANWEQTIAACFLLVDALGPDTA